MSSLIGHQLGNYHLLELLGSGGFAEVYRGKHVYLETIAAVKTLATQLSAAGVEKFRSEARILAALEHPHIIRVLEFGIEQDIPFLVMSYAPNGTLHLPPDTKLPLTTILPYARQVASALQYIHERQLIHLDIKPENLLLGRDHEVLLSDFGVARVIYNGEAQKRESVSGTVSYMAPEQLRGHPCAASDQYSLAVVIYEWLSGVCPFDSTTDLGLAYKHLHSLPQPLGEVVPEIPSAVNQVILRALAKNPDARFPSAYDFYTALEQAAQSHLAEIASESVQSIPSLPAIVSPLATTNMASAPLPSQQGPVQKPGSHAIYRGHQDEVYSVAWSPDGTKIASTSEDGTVQIWDTATMQLLYTYTDHSYPVWMAIWSPDGQRVASAGVNQEVHIWEANTGKSLTTYHGHTSNAVIGFTFTMAWSPDGQYIASGSDDQTVQIWNVTNGRRLCLCEGHKLWVEGIAWSPDGKQVCSGSHDRTVRIWDVGTAREILIYQGHNSQVRTVAWSPNGRQIASAGNDGLVRVWDVSSGRTVLVYRSHVRAIRSVTWSPDGGLIASGGDDRTAQIWRAATGERLFSSEKQSLSVNTVSWSPDGHSIAFGCGDGTVQIIHAWWGSTIG